MICRIESHEALRPAGFSDRDILDLTLIAAYFNFVNRIALGLGARFSAAEMSGYRDGRASSPALAAPSGIVVTSLKIHDLGGNA